LGSESSILISSTLLREILPQKTPFVFVDTLKSHTENGSKASVTITQDMPLIKGEKATAGLILEHMAQTASLHKSYAYHSAAMAPPIGFIAEIKNSKINHLPSLGDTIVTEMTVTNEVFNCIIIECESKCKDEVIATCSMKVLISDNAHQ
jgi:3-hydroxyacyl-[acyl-carrier-protein] dehydratase